MFLLNIIGVNDEDGYSEEMENFIVDWIVESNSRVQNEIGNHINLLEEERK